MHSGLTPQGPCGCAACAAVGSGWMLSLASAPAIIALGALAQVLASAVMAASRCDAAEPTFTLVWRLNHHRPVRWQMLWCRGHDIELLWWSARLPIVVDCADDTVGIISQSLSTYLSFVPSRSPLLFVVVTLWSAHRSSVVIIVVRPTASARFVLHARPSSLNRRQVDDAVCRRQVADAAALVNVRLLSLRCDQYLAAVP